MSERPAIGVCKGNGFSVVNRVVCSGWKAKRSFLGSGVSENTPCDNAEHNHKVVGMTNKGATILNEVNETVKVPVKCGRRIQNPLGDRCAYCGGDLEFYDLKPTKRKEVKE